ncbi:MAG: SPFH domain-containing protein [Candidatus Nealsonbacteria bacterium]
MPENENTNVESQESGDDRWLIMLISFVLEIGLVTVLFYLIFPITFLGGIVGIIVAFGVVPVLIVYFWWAPNNLCFTFVNEGTVKVVVLGGKVTNILIQKEEYTLDNDWNVIPEDSDHRELWHPLGGLRFYGVWPLCDIHLYDFSWTAMLQNGEIKPHVDETLDYALLMDDVYWFEVLKAEDKNRLPLNLQVLVTMRIVNPYKALFAVQDWLEAVIGRIQPVVRDRITQATYEELTINPEAVGHAIFHGPGDHFDIFRDRYGVDVVALEIKEIDPPDDLREITLREVTATREAEATIVAAEAGAKVVVITAKAKAEEVRIGAEAEARAVEIAATAEAGRLEKVYGAIDKQGELGKLARILEALEASPENGSKWVVPIPGILDGLSQIFSGKQSPPFDPPK